MDTYFNPASVVVIGASNSPFNLGATICQSLKEQLEFKGSLYVVNRKREDVHGCPGYVSVEEIPETPELAVIITPAKVVPQFIEQCGKKGIRHVVIESAGFSEEGDAGLSLQKNIDAFAETYGMTFLGPNCLGTLDAHHKFCNFYGTNKIMADMLGELFERPGTLSYIIQSGGVGVLILESLISEVVGLNKMVSIGNKANLDESDLINYFARDNTEVIGLYLENVQKGRKLMKAAREAGKPVMIFKVGRTDAGARAAMSHTAGMANNDLIFDRACRQSGIIRVNSIEELHALPKIFTTMPPLKGKNIAVFTNSGAFGGITSDILVERGLNVVNLSEETQEKLKKTGQIFNVKNPIDLGPAPPQTYIDIFEILLSAPEVDGLLPAASIWQHFVIEVLQELEKMCQTYGKPAAMYSPNAVEKIIPIRREYKLPLFESPEEAVRALEVSHQYYRFTEKRRREDAINSQESNSEQAKSPLRI